MDSTIVKGLRLLELLVRAPGPMRLSAVAKELGLQKSNAHRSLATLVETGYVLQEADTGRYRPTLKLFELGAKVVSDHPIRRAAAPYMQDLHKVLGETVNLYVLDKGAVLVIEKLLSPRPLRFSSQPGSRIPLALTAAGQAMLAHAPDPRAMLVESLPALPPALAASVDVEAVLAGLAGIRERGYSELTSAWTPGIFSIATPLLDREGRAEAALGISGPIERQTPENRQAIIEALLTASARLAENAP